MPDSKDAEVIKSQLTELRIKVKSAQHPIDIENVKHEISQLQGVEGVDQSIINELATLAEKMEQSIQDKETTRIQTAQDAAAKKDAELITEPDKKYNLAVTSFNKHADALSETLENRKKRTQELLKQEPTTSSAIQNEIENIKNEEEKENKNVDGLFKNAAAIEERGVELKKEKKDLENKVLGAKNPKEKIRYEEELKRIAVKQKEQAEQLKLAEKRIKKCGKQYEDQVQQAEQVVIKAADKDPETQQAAAQLKGIKQRRLEDFQKYEAQYGKGTTELYKEKPKALDNNGTAKKSPAEIDQVKQLIRHNVTERAAKANIPITNNNGPTQTPQINKPKKPNNRDLF